MFLGWNALQFSTPLSEIDVRQRVRTVQPNRVRPAVAPASVSQEESLIEKNGKLKHQRKQRERDWITHGTSSPGERYWKRETKVEDGQKVQRLLKRELVKKNKVVRLGID